MGTRGDGRIHANIGCERRDLNERAEEKTGTLTTEWRKTLNRWEVNELSD